MNINQFNTVFNISNTCINKQNILIESLMKEDQRHYLPCLSLLLTVYC